MSLSKSSQNTGQVEKPCEVCEVSYQIQWKCFDCKRYMCSACKETIHPKFKHADKHKIIKTKDITSEDLQEKPDLTSINCTVHDDKFCCLYCKDCEEAICLLCVTKTHSKHDMIELSEGYDICINKLKRFTTHSIKINERIKCIKLVERIRYEDEKKKLLMQEKELIYTIQSQTKILRRELERQWDNFKGTINEKEAFCVETETKCDILNSAEANETFRVAREIHQSMMNEETTRINTDIERPPTFVPRKILSTSIQSVHGWIKKYHNKPVVAAIAIRPNEFKAAFCLQSAYDDYVSNPKSDLAIRSLKWKTSTTSVLIKPNGTVVGILDDTLGDLLENVDVMADQYLFEHLGKTLYDKQVVLNSDTWLKESKNRFGRTAKKMKALDVFSNVIVFLKGSILKAVSEFDQSNEFNIEDVFWVFTVPNICRTKRENFMHEAVMQAASSNEKFTIALEPDALSVYCEYVYGKRQREDDDSYIDIGGTYIIFDQGDGTTNVTVHEVTGPRFVKEIYSGDCWQWNSLSFEEYSSFLNQLCSLDVISILEEHEHIDYDDMVYCFESAIRNFRLDSTEMVTVTISVAPLEKLTNVPLGELISQSKFKTNVTHFADKLRFTSSFFRTFFESSIKYVSGILDECIHAINKEKLAEITTIFVVGECSQSSILTDVIKQKFGPSIKVIVESSHTTAVSVGALLCEFQ